MVISNRQKKLEETFLIIILDDDNLAIAIGDASGKGVPAALFSMISQVNIKEMLKHTKKPETVLYLLNNQLFESDDEPIKPLINDIHNFTKDTELMMT